MRKPGEIAASVWSFYRDGFRNMTWGKPLVWLILLKIFILFGILRVFFFRPAMAGMTEDQKSEQVAGKLVQPTEYHIENITTD